MEKSMCINSIDNNTEGVYMSILGKNICKSGETCTWDDGLVISKTVTIDVEMDTESTEIWNIHVKEKHYIYLSFTLFDIGCQSGSILELVISTTEKHTLCNTNKPVVGGINSTYHIMKITFKYQKRANRLTEGFKAEYATRKIPRLDRRHITQEDTGKPCVNPSLLKNSICKILNDKLLRHYATQHCLYCFFLFDKTKTCV